LLVARQRHVSRRRVCVGVVGQYLLCQRYSERLGHGGCLLRRCRLHTASRHIRDEGHVYGATCSDHVESWSWPGPGSIGIIASSLVAMPPRQRGPARGDEVIASGYVPRHADEAAGEAGGGSELTYRAGSLGPGSMVTAWTFSRLPSVCSLAIRSAASRASVNPIQRQGPHSSLHAEATASRRIAHHDCRTQTLAAWEGAPPNRWGATAVSGGGCRRSCRPPS